MKLEEKHGNFNCTKENSYGSVCSIECTKGYTVNGSKSLTCLSNGNWVTTNGDLPSCIINLCPNAVFTVNKVRMSLFTKLLNGKMFFI